MPSRFNQAEGLPPHACPGGSNAGRPGRHLLRACAALLLLLSLPMPGYAAAPADVPAKNMVTMVDLGAKSCIPCKMMVPVLDQVTKEYEGKAAIVFIDVWENPAESKKYGLKAIPTQIFYDRQGQEVFRHEGFFDKQAISGVLDKLLAQ